MGSSGVANKRLFDFQLSERAGYLKKSITYTVSNIFNTTVGVVAGIGNILTCGTNERLMFYQGEKLKCSSSILDVFFVSFSKSINPKMEFGGNNQYKTRSITFSVNRFFISRE
jgi:hypothetical protein